MDAFPEHHTCKGFLFLDVSPWNFLNVSPGTIATPFGLGLEENPKNVSSQLHKFSDI